MRLGRSDAHHQASVPCLRHPRWAQPGPGNDWQERSAQHGFPLHLPGEFT